eukprot:1261307-Pleurochrysis_carterae.AAC.1
MERACYGLFGKTFFTIRSHTLDTFIPNARDAFRIPYPDGSTEDVIFPTNLGLQCPESGADSPETTGEQAALERWRAHAIADRSGGTAAPPRQSCRRRPSHCSRGTHQPLAAQAERVVSLRDLKDTGVLVGGLA